MEKNMQRVQPKALTDKELLSAALLMFEPDTGMPVEFQKELIRRLASFVEASLPSTTDYKTSDPNQLPLFD
jgi:hypothetical protein